MDSSVVSRLSPLVASSDALSRAASPAAARESMRHARDLPTRHDFWATQLSEPTLWLLDGRPILYRVRWPSPSWAALCFPPKTGSTSWKLQLLRALQLQGLPAGDRNLSVHVTRLPYDVARQNVSIRDVPRLMVMRHPVARLLSGFLAKAAPSATERFKGVPGWNRSANFSAFVHAVTRTSSAMLNPHYRLQSAQCGLPAGLTWHYLRMEEIGRWYHLAVCALGLQQVVGERTVGDFPGITDKRSCFVDTSDCGCAIDCAGPKCNASWAQDAYAAFGTQSEEQLARWYDPKLAEHVNAWARSDLDLFGYEPWVHPTARRAEQTSPSPGAAAARSAHARSRKAPVRARHGYAGVIGLMGGTHSRPGTRVGPQTSRPQTSRAARRARFARAMHGGLAL